MIGCGPSVSDLEKTGDGGDDCIVHFSSSIADHLTRTPVLQDHLEEDHFCRCFGGDGRGSLRYCSLCSIVCHDSHVGVAQRGTREGTERVDPNAGEGQETGSKGHRKPGGRRRDVLMEPQLSHERT